MEAMTPKARPVMSALSCEAWVELVPWTDGVRWEGRCNLSATVHVPHVNEDGMAYRSHFCADHAPTVALTVAQWEARSRLEAPIGGGA